MIDYRQWAQQNPGKALLGASTLSIIFAVWFSTPSQTPPTPAADRSEQVRQKAGEDRAEAARRAKEHQDFLDAKAAAAAAEAQAPVTELSIAELGRALSLNELSAEKRFGGQKIAITGRIERVFVHSEGNPIAVLRENGVRGRCVFGTWMKDFAATLVVGEQFRCLGKLMVGGATDGPDVFMGYEPGSR